MGNTVVSHLLLPLQRGVFKCDHETRGARPRDFEIKFVSDLISSKQFAVLINWVYCNITQGESPMVEFSLFYLNSCTDRVISGPVGTVPLCSHSLTTG